MTKASELEPQLADDGVQTTVTMHLKKPLGAVDSVSGLGVHVSAIVDPTCQMSSDPSHPDLVGLHLRHPDLGWLSFALTKSTARSLGESLVAFAAAPSERAGTN